MKKNRRQTALIIERDFQYRMTLRICLLASSVFLIFGSVLLFLVKINYETLIQDALIQMPDMVQALRREFRLLSLGMVTVLIVMVGVMFGLGLVLTNRIAGPLLALKRQLQNFAEGKSGVRLNLRAKDEFQNLQNVFNSAMESHDQRQKQLILKVDETLNTLQEQQNLLKAVAALEHLKNDISSGQKE